MLLPLINTPTIYHVGTLNRRDRAKQYQSSHEGSWLSASRCPHAWSQIAKLGGQPCWELKRPDAFFLDFNAIPDDLQNTILHWAWLHDLIDRHTVYELHSWDVESEKKTSIFFNTIEEAEAEWESQGLDDDGSAKIVKNDVFYVLTKRGRARANQDEQLQMVDLFATQFWIEDVLSKTMPQVVGVYMDEGLDPDNYSAPRFAVFPDALYTFQRDVVDLATVDEEYLSYNMPTSRWIQESDFKSPYTLVTTCVQSIGEDINSMIDDPAMRNLPYMDFAHILNAGKPGSGRKLLSKTFPIPGEGMKLENDWHVSYHASSYQGIPCLYVVHSAIEHVFQQRALYDAPVVALTRDSEGCDEEIHSARLRQQ